VARENAENQGYTEEGAETETPALTRNEQLVADQYDAVGDRKKRTFVGDQMTSLGPKKVLGLRAKLASNSAPLEHYMTMLWSGKTRNLAGELNPFIQYSQAVDAPRVALAGLRDGIVELGTHGLFESALLHYA